MIQKYINFIKNGFNPRLVKSKKNIIAGEKSYYNGKIVAKGTGKIYVGSYCTFGPGLRIISSNHNYHYPFLQGSMISRDLGGVHPEMHIAKDVHIGNDVWTGDNVIITPGATIGNGAIVGAGAVVTKNIPSYAIVGGIPAKIIKYRFSEEKISFLEKLSWWDWPLEKKKRNITFFQTDLEKITLEEIREIIVE